MRERENETLKKKDANTWAASAVVVVVVEKSPAAQHE